MDLASTKGESAESIGYCNELTRRSYWDLPYDDYRYSYIGVATDQYKYCTLSYDRLGLGASSHGDPVNELQASLEVALLAEITVMLREGKYPGAAHPFKKVVHVGCVTRHKMLLIAHTNPRSLATLSDLPLHTLLWTQHPPSQMASHSQDSP